MPALPCIVTSSCAVTERPRDALFPSVVRFSSVIGLPRAQSFIIVTLASDLSLRTTKCCSVVFGKTLRLLVINTSSSSPVNKKKDDAAYQRRVSPTCHGQAKLCVLHFAVKPLTARDEDRYWLRIVIFAYPTCK